MQYFVLGVLYGIIGQVLSFIQLQAGIKWGWTDKYSWALMLLGLPISLSFMHSVKNFILAFDGEIWPSRLNGFGIGVIVFSLMGWYLFKEPVSLKTWICLLLSLGIILVQVLWK
jgi:multidrug transporter EmrE-like cation transporter